MRIRIELEMIEVSDLAVCAIENTGLTDARINCMDCYDSSGDDCLHDDGSNPCGDECWDCDDQNVSRIYY